MTITGPELLIVCFNALSPEEQEEAFARISEIRLRRLAGEEGTTGRILRSLQRVADHLGDEPLTSTSYRKAWAELRNEGEEVESLPTVIRHFGGSWRACRQAFDLSATTTARRIEARFANRKLGRTKQYSEQTLRQSVVNAMNDLGFETPPRLAEYLHWRQGKQELARAQGEVDPNLPGGGPYRRRWGSWPGALSALGWSDEEITDRLDRRPREKKTASRS
jgi:hypothetical protein